MAKFGDKAEFNLKSVEYEPIGIVHSPHKQRLGTPIQPTAARGIEGSIEIYPQFVPGLEGPEGFSHIILIYHFHLARKKWLKTKPYLADEEFGIFAIRSPLRPNPIGISILQLDKIVENILYIRDVDILEGTPVLDIKPYVPEFDCRQKVKTGWLNKSLHKLKTAKNEGR